MSVLLAHCDSMVAACCLQVRNIVTVTGGMLPWSRRARQPRQPSQCSQPIMAAWWQHAVPRQEPCHFPALWRCWLCNRKGIRAIKTFVRPYSRMMITTLSLQSYVLSGRSTMPWWVLLWLNSRNVLPQSAQTYDDESVEQNMGVCMFVNEDVKRTDSELMISWRSWKILCLCSSSSRIVMRSVDDLSTLSVYIFCTFGIF